MKKNTTKRRVSRRTKITLAATAGVLIGGLAIAGVAHACKRGGHHGDRHGGDVFNMFISEMDADGDGTITKAEAESHARLVFDEMDADGNSSVSADEMVTQRISKLRERLDERIAKRLERMDSNGDGEIGFDEMQTQERVSKVFDRHDRNDDGVLDADEIAKMKSRGHKGKKRGRGY